MYRKGERVFHPEFGWGRFDGVVEQGKRMAHVEFPGRGDRFFVLPTTNLLTTRQFLLLDPMSRYRLLSGAVQPPRGWLKMRYQRHQRRPESVPIGVAVDKAV